MEWCSPKVKQEEGKQKEEASESKEVSAILLEADLHGYSGGAELEWCTQFPGQQEVLFASLTGLELVGFDAEQGGSSSVLVAKIRLNQVMVVTTFRFAFKKNK